MEWYTEVLNSNISQLSNYDMNNIKKLFTPTTNGIVASNGREIMSLSQESHDYEDSNNDNDGTFTDMFNAVTPNTSLNAFNHLKMHYSHLCSLGDGNKDAIEFVETKFQEISSDVCNYLITQNLSLKPNTESSLVSSGLSLHKKKSHKKQKRYK